VDWIKRFILFHHKRHPATMGAPEVSAFLSHLVVEGKVADPPKLRNYEFCISKRKQVP
jgi:hypothetical protein